jgi:hypothetical protein
MRDVVSKKTRQNIQRDIEQGNLGKVRDRLHGLLVTYPNELSLRKELGDIYYRLQDLQMAGRYWYLEKEKTVEMTRACLLFEKECGDNPAVIARALKFKEDKEQIHDLCIQEMLSQTQRTVIGKLIEPPEEETIGDKLIVAGCALIFLTVVSFLIIGVYTVCTWVF